MYLIAPSRSKGHYLFYPCGLLSDRLKREERRREELYRQYYEEIKRRFDAERPVDCSVIVVNKQTKYENSYDQFYYCMVEKNGIKLSPALRLCVLQVAIEEGGFRALRKRQLLLLFWEYMLIRWRNVVFCASLLFPSCHLSLYLLLSTYSSCQPTVTTGCSGLYLLFMG